MPVTKKKDGFYFGKMGPYKTRQKAEAMERGAYSRGYGSNMRMMGHAKKGKKNKDEMVDEMEQRLDDLAKRIVRLKGMYRRRMMPRMRAY